MSLIGIDNAEAVDFVSDKDTDKQNPTVFKIGLITNRQKMKFFASNESDSVQRIGDLLSCGLKGIKNLKLAGKNVDVDNVSDAVIDMLPFDVVMEVVNKVIEYNQLSGDERKN